MKLQSQNYDKRRYIVWGNHAGSVHAAFELLQSVGQTVLEGARLQEIFDEQKIRLTHTSDDDSRILRAGRLAGADQVVFIEAFDRPEVVSGSFVTDRAASSHTGTGHQVSVSARAVDIESSEVKWSGHSTFPQSVTNPEEALPILTRAAMLRAVCAIERGREWVEPGAETTWGCKPKGSERRESADGQ
jgi:hypothetical protein